MDIYQYYLKQNAVNGFSYDELRDIINYNNSHLTVKASNGRLVMNARDETGRKRLQDNISSRIVKCIKEYYKMPDKSFTFKSNNAFLLCDRVRAHFEMELDVARSDCRACHLCAMQRYRDDRRIERK